jgi:hypothetical protein
VQPSVNCSITSTPEAKLWQGASFWAGLDGYFGIHKDTVEQIGTLAKCVYRRPSYQAWGQFYPGPSFAYADTVKPGDTISAAVSTDGNGDFTLMLADASEGWKHTMSWTEPGSGWPKGRPTSAEVIAEAQTSPYGWYPPTLAEFGKVRFTGATADGKSFGDLNGLHPIYMVQTGKLKAAPSPVASGAFSVTAKHS